MDEEPMSFKAPAFVCPHCNAYAHHVWDALLESASSSGFEDAVSETAITRSVCAKCSGFTLWETTLTLSSSGPRGGLNPNTPTPRTEHTLLHPIAARTGPQPNEDMPSDVRGLYDEAAQVAPLSPRAGSALLRVALEALLRGLYPDEKGNLDALIGLAVKDGVPQGVQQAMDYVRFRGNDSAHKILTDDTQQTVSVLFGLLNLVTENLITRPRHIAELYETIPEGKREHIDQRNQKVLATDD